MSGSQSAMFGGGKTRKFQRFLASGTFTPTAKHLALGGWVEYDLIAGGGAGGGAGIAQNYGAGGATSRERGWLQVSGATSVTIGAGGVAAVGLAGGDGAASSFGAVSVPGGKGGSQNGGPPGNSGGLHGLPGFSASNPGGFSGSGAGEGAGAGNNNSTGNSAAPNSGGGGGGGGYLGSSRAGGNGGSGRLDLYWEE